MKEKKIRWHFQQFLIENKAYKAFVDNVEADNNSFKGTYGITSVKFLLNEFNSEDWIGYAFNWSKTTQGDAFWRNLYFKWKSTLNDLEKL